MFPSSGEGRGVVHRQNPSEFVSMYSVAPSNGQISGKGHMNMTSEVHTAVIAQSAVI
jgi:hypothetical protein